MNSSTPARERRIIFEFVRYKYYPALIKEICFRISISKLCNKAALTIQCFYRQYSARRLICSMKFKRLEEKIVLIQSQFRIFNSKNLVAKLRQEKLIGEAAIVIQKYIRRYHCRLLFDKIRAIRLYHSISVILRSIYDYVLKKRRIRNVAATFIQSFIRSYIYFIRYQSKRSSIIKIQCVIRMKLSFLAAKSRLEPIIKIQTFVRRWLAQSFYEKNLKILISSFDIHVSPRKWWDVVNEEEEEGVLTWLESKGGIQRCENGPKVKLGQLFLFQNNTSMKSETSSEKHKQNDENGRIEKILPLHMDLRSDSIGDKKRSMKLVFSQKQSKDHFKTTMNEKEEEEEEKLDGFNNNLDSTIEYEIDYVKIEDEMVMVRLKNGRFVVIIQIHCSYQIEVENEIVSSSSSYQPPTNSSSTIHQDPSFMMNDDDFQEDGGDLEMKEKDGLLVEFEGGFSLNAFSVEEFDQMVEPPLLDNQRIEFDESSNNNLECNSPLSIPLVDEMMLRRWAQRRIGRVILSYIKHQRDLKRHLKMRELNERILMKREDDLMMAYLHHLRIIEEDENRKMMLEEEMMRDWLEEIRRISASTIISSWIYFIFQRDKGRRLLWERRSKIVIIQSLFRRR